MLKPLLSEAHVASGRPVGTEVPHSVQLLNLPTLRFSWVQHTALYCSDHIATHSQASHTQEHSKRVHFSELPISNRSAQKTPRRTGVTCPIGLRARLTRVNGAPPVDPCPIDRPRAPIDRGKPPNASLVVPRGNWQAFSPSLASGARVYRCPIDMPPSTQEGKCSSQCVFPLQVFVRSARTNGRASCYHVITTASILLWRLVFSRFDVKITKWNKPTSSN